MSPAPLVFALVFLLLPVTPLVAQRPSVGVLVGRSLVGGGDSRTLVGSGVTGADQAGLHLRAFADLPLERSPFSFRAELFYNRLTSGPNTFDAGVYGKAALVDRTVGLSGSFVAMPHRRASVAPYFSLGAGLFTSHLGHNPDVFSTRVTETYNGTKVCTQSQTRRRHEIGRVARVCAGVGGYSDRVRRRRQLQPQRSECVRRIHRIDFYRHHHERDDHSPRGGRNGDGDLGCGWHHDRSAATGSRSIKRPTPSSVMSSSPRRKTV